MELQPGTKVSWTHIGGGGRSISMTLREGTVERINAGVATIKTKGGRRVEVAVRRLRVEGQPSQIAEFVEAMRESSRG